MVCGATGAHQGSRTHKVDAHLAAKVATVVQRQRQRQRQRTLGVRQCGAVGLAQQCILGGQRPAVDGAIGDTRALEVLGDLAGYFGLAPGAPRLQPQCRAVVGLALCRFCSRST